MKLIEEWRSVAAKAWSVRLASLSALLSALEVFVQLTVPDHPAPWLAGVAAGVGLAAALARIVAQPKTLSANA